MSTGGNCRNYEYTCENDADEEWHEIMAQTFVNYKVFSLLVICKSYHGLDMSYLTTYRNTSSKTCERCF